MKAFTDLNLGFTNAENYRRRENKELLRHYFVKDQFLERLLNPNIYFLVGEKGTGKTAYSTFLRNEFYRKKYALAYDVRQTEYQKFLELKKAGHLPLSQYSEVWRTLLLIAAATSILEKSSTPDFLQRFTKLGALKRALDEFYGNAFAPEIVKILSFVEESERSVSLIAKYAGAQGGITNKDRTETKDSNSIFQTNLLSLRRSFEGAINALKLDNDYIIFIDGIDVRPSEISYADYFECVSGLIAAIWSINNDFLSNIKDTVGRIKFVLLVRPDIFLRAGLHNVNTKIRDNSVFLDWQTTYKDYRTSRLFEVADKLLSSQQDRDTSQNKKSADASELSRSKDAPVGSAWDHYFPFLAQNIKVSRQDEPGTINSFLAFLRFSYYRPRDINAMLDTMRIILSRRGTVHQVTASDFNDPTFRDAHADYLLGELRDQLLFYYSQDEFDLFVQFFQYLNGKKRFSYEEFSSALMEFVSECKSSDKALPKFFESTDIFLQFLYEQNVICYIETDAEDELADNFIRWCFRERTQSNLAPKVRANVDYEIFYGLTKALNVGRRIKIKKSNRTTEFGTVIRIDSGLAIGTIRGGATQNEYGFRFDQLEKDYIPAIGDRVSYTLTIIRGEPEAQFVVRAPIT